MVPMLNANLSIDRNKELWKIRGGKELCYNKEPKDLVYERGKMEQVKGESFSDCGNHFAKYAYMKLTHCTL